VPAVRPGLANAPALGTQSGQADAPHDVIANAEESCGRALDPGPLRGRILPCPRVASTAPAPVRPPPTDADLVMPWVDHFYLGFPCRRMSTWVAEEMVVARSPALVDGGSCAR
jgi:hypothetical protein